MKSPSEITSITNELSTNSNTKNNTEQKSMKSPSEITIVATVSSTKLSYVIDQVSSLNHLIQHLSIIMNQRYMIYQRITILIHVSVIIIILKHMFART